MKKNSRKAYNFLYYVRKIKLEELLQDKYLHLSANENVISPSIRNILASSLHNRYNLGHSLERKQQDFIVCNNFTYTGLKNIYPIESEAHEIFCGLFNAELADFRPLSGLHALTCILSTSSNPSDVIYCLNPNYGGHSSTTNLLKQMGRQVNYLPINKNLEVDLEQFKYLASKSPPKAILFDHADPLYSFDIDLLHSVIKYNLPVIYDASHTLGLIAGQQFENPFKKKANIIIGNTHKTFPGPQKGVIIYKDLENGLKISKKIGASMLSSQNTNNSIVTYLTILEMNLFGLNYAKQILKNSITLSMELETHGFKLFRRKNEFTQTHIVFIDTIKTNSLDPIEASKKLFQNCITSNARFAYNKKLLRIGVQEITRMGLIEEDMCELSLAIRYLLIDNHHLEARKIILSLIKKQRINFSIDNNY